MLLLLPLSVSLFPAALEAGAGSCSLLLLVSQLLLLLLLSVEVLLLLLLFVVLVVVLRVPSRSSLMVNDRFSQ